MPDITGVVVPGYTGVNPVKDSNAENKINKTNVINENSLPSQYPSAQAVYRVVQPKADKVNGATAGNLAGLDANGNLTDSGVDPGTLAPLDNPVFTGTPQVPTAEAGTDTKQAASTAFVQAAVALVASSASKAEEYALGAYVTPTASGDIASFDDGAEDVPVKSLVVDIKPVQAGTGDPSPENVRPISGWTKAKVQRTGKNLFNKNASTILTGNTEWTNTGIDFTGTDRLVGILINYLKPNTQYTISYVPNKTVRIGMSTVSYLNYELGYVYTNAGEKGSLVFTTPDDVSNLTIGFYDTTVEPYTVSEIQIEAGGTSTAYEPYQGNTYDISFPDEAGTVYGGTLDVTNGVLTVDRAYKTYIGEDGEGWKLQSANSYSIANYEVQLYDYAGPHHSRGITNYLSPQISLIAETQTEGFFINDNGTFYVRLNSQRVGNLEEFKVWLKNNPLQLVYELATPIIYQLTPTEVKTLLGMNNIHADTGDVDVTYRADPTIIYNKLTAAIISSGGTV